ncbi:hypothetical protein M8818_003414 [Zalaria obscura]|uniref:Uncharacterized protein n=1 Tax=Zalaria obscura TaxID=2024903 RepID=A0ACC3SFM7_9PEZI
MVQDRPPLDVSAIIRDKLVSVEDGVTLGHLVDISTKAQREVARSITRPILQRKRPAAKVRPPPPTVETDHEEAARASALGTEGGVARVASPSGAGAVAGGGRLGRRLVKVQGAVAHCFSFVVNSLKLAWEES